MVIVAWALVVAPKARNGAHASRSDVIGTAILLFACGRAGRRRPAVAGLALRPSSSLNAVVLAALGPGARDAFGLAGRSR